MNVFIRHPSLLLIHYLTAWSYLKMTRNILWFTHLRRFRMWTGPLSSPLLVCSLFMLKTNVPALTLVILCITIHSYHMWCQPAHHIRLLCFKIWWIRAILLLDCHLWWLVGQVTPNGRLSCQPFGDVNKKYIQIWMYTLVNLSFCHVWWIFPIVFLSDSAASLYSSVFIFILHKFLVFAHLVALYADCIVKCQKTRCERSDALFCFRS